MTHAKDTMQDVGEEVEMRGTENTSKIIKCNGKYQSMLSTRPAFAPAACLLIHLIREVRFLEDFGL
jgi:hypothetical protein